MEERRLVAIYKIGRNKGYLPNTEDLNKFVYDELINECWGKDELLDLWYTIYGTYSKSGILEKCYQLNLKDFSWCDVHNLMVENNQRTLKSAYGKYLKNRRSKR